MLAPIARKNISNYFTAGIILTILFGIFTPKIDAVQTTTTTVGSKERTTFQLRDAAIRKILVSISTGKLPPNDDQLVELIAENIKEAAFEPIEPSVGIEAAARQAQEAVSEITAAYTAIIFQSTSVKEASNLFNRYEKTVNKIVDFAKSGNFVVRYNPKQISSNN